jgi:hypothetical protein
VQVMLDTFLKQENLLFVVGLQLDASMVTLHNPWRAVSAVHISGQYRSCKDETAAAKVCILFLQGW